MERESKSSANMFDLISRVVSGNGFKNCNSSKGLGIVEDENDGNSSRDRKRAGNSACRKILGYGKGNGCSIGGESRGGKGVVNKKAEMNDENWVRLNPVKGEFKVVHGNILFPRNVDKCRLVFQSMHAGDTVFDFPAVNMSA
ncbi:hypothetical protein AYI70_g10991, partial [Smittium culicis]